MRALLGPWRVPALPLAVPLAVLALTLVVLAGWAADVPVLTSVVPGYQTMKVNTAVCLAALAVSLLVRRRWLVLTLCAFVALVAGLSLVEQVTGWVLGIDELLVSDGTSSPGMPPGRMAPSTAVSLLSLAGARVALLRGARRWTHALCAPAFLVGYVVLVGYLLGAQDLYTVSSHTTVALPTAVLLLALGAATLSQLPDSDVVWALHGQDAGAILMRRYLPVVLVGLPVLGRLVLAGMDAGYYGDRFDLAIQVFFGVLFVVVATRIAAGQLRASSRREERARADLERLTERLSEGRDAQWVRAEALARELAEQQAQFRRALSSVDDLVWTVRVDGGSARVVYLSSPGTALFGGPMPETLEGYSMTPLVHPADRDAYARFNARLVAGEPAEVELRVNGLDGVTRWLWVRATPRHEGEQLFCDGVTTNISERKRLAQERESLIALQQERMDQMAEVNRMREEFIAVAGHELRTPLTAVVGHAHLLLEDDDNLTDAQRRALRVITNRSSQLTGLVDDFFELAKLNAGMTQLRREPLPLDVVVAETCVAHEHEAAAAGLALDADTRPCQVLGDATALRRVVDNLLSNAIKYTPAGGRVVVRLRAVAGAEGDELVLSVSDTGVGIAADQVPHVFDHLYRATPTDQRGVEGTGIGLAVTKALVEAHGGTIEVASSPDAGSVFTVRLPAAARREGRLRTQPAPPLMPPAPSLVEDDEEPARRPSLVEEGEEGEERARLETTEGRLSG